METSWRKEDLLGDWTGADTAAEKQGRARLDALAKGIKARGR
jgi:hypothetical protein